ncbi:hypothetical protein BDA96_02G400300 [Sorghum bicolor]|uniref:Trehalose 6-phosphate phosphatase n=4 Tax=Sorghum bicolor TaxID=4558 RepID=A0A921RUD7_SORBI|nr:probable trehalose-phosphate phosphatase 3 [Sorghum bicolor]EER97569.1 hypothetical protein SORBI_3002G381500 [Sorghum bicolor]KAG0545886.1 hypothetical protein BDA96_02G400300 [Sorghum bicolor]|eukprot:XP_002461048.1 probable trehalose-phosphate phosphatase 3 [Sorghum bicolor]
MTKHTAFAADDAITAAAGVTSPQPGRRFTSYPPPTRARGGCRLAAAAARQATDPGAAGVAAGSWPELVPRHADFDDWMEKHPSALAEFESVLATAKGKQIVMFLDYDGTLTPIVKDPDSAVMSEEMRDAVRGVAEHFPTAIVSGRCRDKVFNFVKLAELYYAGSHGMDIKGPTAQSKHTKAKAEAVLCQPASAFLPVIDEVYRTLTARTAPIPGATVENNKFCLSVHFRCVQEEKWRALEEQVRSVLKEYPDLRLTKGRKVLEIRPSIEWDKGNALQFLLESLGFADSNDNVFPIYIGDDRTDEDAFKVLRSMGQGIGILVSKIPKETAASYSLREPSEVKEFLRKLVRSKQRD